MKFILDKMIILLFAGLLFGGVCFADDKEAANTLGVQFNWAFGAWVESDGGRRLISIDKDMHLNSGDRLKFFVQPVNQCHIYLIYHGSQGEMHLLFPTQTASGNQAVNPSIPYLIPEGMGWFSIDSMPGLERFYLLASAEPLSELEELLEQLKKSGSRDQEKLVQAIRAHIKQLKKERRTLAAAAERPISIGGSVRGSEPDTAGAYPDVRQLANQISAATFFSRTFTIEHP